MNSDGLIIKISIYNENFDYFHLINYFYKMLLLIITILSSVISNKNTVPPEEVQEPHFMNTDELQRSLFEPGSNYDRLIDANYFLLLTKKPTSVHTRPITARRTVRPGPSVTDILENSELFNAYQDESLIRSFNKTDELLQPPSDTSIFMSSDTKPDGTTSEERAKRRESEAERNTGYNEMINIKMRAEHEKNNEVGSAESITYEAKKRNKRMTKMKKNSRGKFIEQISKLKSQMVIKMKKRRQNQQKKKKSAKQKQHEKEEKYKKWERKKYEKIRKLAMESGDGETEMEWLKRELIMKRKLFKNFEIYLTRAQFKDAEREIKVLRGSGRGGKFKLNWGEIFLKFGKRYGWLAGKKKDDQQKSIAMDGKREGSEREYDQEVREKKRGQRNRCTFNWCPGNAPMTNCTAPNLLK